jgi:hypothetical protein
VYAAARRAGGRVRARLPHGSCRTPWHGERLESRGDQRVWRSRPPWPCSPAVPRSTSAVSPGACRPDPAYFADALWLTFLAPADAAASCVAAAGCHRLEDGRSALRLDTGDPPDLDGNYVVVTRFLNCGSPGSSSLLTKPISGVDPHGGGDLFAPGSAAEAAFLGWFP